MLILYGINSCLSVGNTLLYIYSDSNPFKLISEGIEILSKISLILSEWFFIILNGLPKCIFLKFKFSFFTYSISNNPI